MAPHDIRKHLPLLKFIASSKPKIRKAIIDEGGPNVIRLLCECSHNLINGNCNLSSAQFKKVKRYKKQLRLLADKKVSVKRKRKELQKGGFVGALLGAVLPTIAGLVGNLIGRK